MERKDKERELEEERWRKGGAEWEQVERKGKEREREEAR